MPTAAAPEAFAVNAGKRRVSSAAFCRLCLDFLRRVAYLFPHERRVIELELSLRQDDATLVAAALLGFCIRQLKQGVARRELIAKAFFTQNPFLRGAWRRIIKSGLAGKYLTPGAVFLLAQIEAAPLGLAARFFQNAVALARPLLVELEQSFLAAVQAGDHAKALELGARLLEQGASSPRLLLTLSDCCLKKFHFYDGAVLAAFGASLFPDNGEFGFLALRQALLADKPFLALFCLCQFAANQVGPPQLERNRLGMKLDATYGEFDWQAIFHLLKTGRLPYERKADANKAPQGLEACLQLDQRDSIAISLKKHERGEAIITNASLLFYGYFALGKPQQAFRSLATDPQFNILNRYYRDKIALNLENLAPVRSALVLSECYTADELSYSRFYPQIKRRLGAARVKFTCDYRALPILQRTFPELEFVPCHKARELEFIADWERYRQLPAADCVRYLDNEAARECAKADRIVTVMHALGSVITDYESYRQLPLLQVDAQKKATFRQRLEKLRDASGKKRIVGLGWRSYVSGSDREGNFLKKNLLSHLAAVPDILWVSCQYDGLRPEEAEFFRNWPGNFVQCPEVDQFNDLDSTGAFYASLDLMVAAPTFTADYAASVGTAVLCPANNLLFKSYCFPQTNIHCALPACEFQPCRSEAEIAAFGQSLRRKLLRKDSKVSSAFTMASPISR